MDVHTSVLFANLTFRNTGTCMRMLQNIKAAKNMTILYYCIRDGYESMMS